MQVWNSETRVFDDWPEESASAHVRNAPAASVERAMQDLGQEAAIEEAVITINSAIAYCMLWADRGAMSREAQAWGDCLDAVQRQIADTQRLLAKTH